MEKEKVDREERLNAQVDELRKENESLRIELDQKLKEKDLILIIVF